MRYLLIEKPMIWSRFTSGDIVTITIYDALDDSVKVNAASMNELATTGWFKYQFNPMPSVATDYFYIASNSSEEHAGAMPIGGYPENISSILDIENGRWKITGNQMIFYSADNITEIMRFNLFDKDGIPSEENVMERQRV